MIKKYTKQDLETAYHAGQTKRWDTGVSLYSSFKEFFKIFNKKK